MADKNARRKVAKKKVLARREFLRSERKKLMEQERKSLEAKKIVHGRPVPLILNAEKIAEREEIRKKMLAEKLQKNLELLKTLEKEFESEQAARSQFNTIMEAEGHRTIAQKMEAIHKKAEEMAAGAKDRVEELKK